MGSTSEDDCGARFSMSSCMSVGIGAFEGDRDGRESAKKRVHYMYFLHASFSLVLMEELRKL